MDNLFRTPRTLVMGVLNVTPDSFSDGGQYFGVEEAVDRAQEMAEEGADILDIGGESSRPGSLPVPTDEEERRVLPVIERLTDELHIPLSIDTRRALIARKALDMGVIMVNDISGLRDDPAMGQTVAEENSYVVIMHMKGTPKDMQVNPAYG
ncbi:MAG: dihydropteroate synthase, partial [Fidelibacterota bacterium]